MKLLPLILIVVLTGCKAWQIHEDNEKRKEAQSAPDAMPPKPPGLMLSWNYDGGPIDGFHLYSTPEVAPLPWPLFATIPPELREWRISAGDANRFFALTAFSEAGESDYAR